jgi:uncharacterized protein (DUF2132 family)
MRSVRPSSRKCPCAASLKTSKRGLAISAKTTASVSSEAAQPGNPLHGVTLETIVTALAAHYGWEELGRRIAIRCFTSDPSVASSLKFLRKTPWARQKVEGLYLFMLREMRRGDTSK